MDGATCFNENHPACAANCAITLHISHRRARSVNRDSGTECANGGWLHVVVSRRINDMKQYKLYWKSRLVCVDRGGNMRAPRYETEWYLSEHP